MHWNRIGRLAMVLTAGLVLATGCRSAKTDRIRYLEAENAKLSNERADLTDKVVVEKSDKFKEEARRKAAEAELRATRARYDALLDAERGGIQPIDTPGVTVQPRSNGQQQILISSDITFRPGQATLTTNAEKALAKVAKVLKEGDYRAIRVEGHTDSDPIRKSGWKSNKELSLERAKRVSGALARHGIPNGLMEVAGFGSDDPLVENKTAAGKAKNRRVVITVID